LNNLRVCSSRSGSIISPNSRLIFIAALPLKIRLPVPCEVNPVALGFLDGFETPAGQSEKLPRLRPFSVLRHLGGIDALVILHPRLRPRIDQPQVAPVRYVEHALARLGLAHLLHDGAEYALAELVEALALLA
jgi:hypothetical protein